MQKVFDLNYSLLLILKIKIALGPYLMSEFVKQFFPLGVIKHHMWLYGSFLATPWKWSNGKLYCGGLGAQSLKYRFKD